MCNTNNLSSQVVGKKAKKIKCSSIVVRNVYQHMFEMDILLTNATQATWSSWWQKPSLSHTQNHRMVWVGRDLKDHAVPAPVPWAGTPSTRPGCSKPHPTWSWTLLGRGQPQLLFGNLCQCLTTPLVKNFFLIFSLNLPSFSLKPLPLVLSLHAVVKSPSPALL